MTVIHTGDDLLKKPPRLGLFQLWDEEEEKEKISEMWIRLMS